MMTKAAQKSFLSLIKTKLKMIRAPIKGFISTFEEDVMSSWAQISKITTYWLSFSGNNFMAMYKAHALNITHSITPKPSGSSAKGAIKRAKTGP